VTASHLNKTFITSTTTNNNFFVSPLKKKFPNYSNNISKSFIKRDSINLNETNENADAENQDEQNKLEAMKNPKFKRITEEEYKK
jgi:hypothetical protein